MPKIRVDSIPVMKYRKVFFGISIALMLISFLAIGIRGLNFGIEFQGGSSIDLLDTGSVTTEEVRDAFLAAGEENPVIQTTEQQGREGFLVRTSTADPQVATKHAQTAATSLGLSTDQVQVTTIGPDWGSNVTKSSLLAFLVSIGLIILLVSIRYEFKMSITGVASLLHDLIIVCGVYALLGREITPNVIAALLTIMGYSLYDTVVVFHRISENSKSAEHKRSTMFNIVNRSVAQVIVRSVNTTLTSLIPVLAMLFFGGETLKDFAFAMSLGLILGSYSSLGLSAPLFGLWKSREPEWSKRQKRFEERQAKESSAGK